MVTLVKDNVEQAYTGNEALPKDLMMQILYGTELATLLIQAFQDDRVPPDLTSMDQCYAIIDAYEECTFSPAEYAKVATAALKWLHSSEHDTAPSSVSTLHVRVGQYLFSTHDLEWLPTAIAHIARTSDMDSLADILQGASKA